MILTIFKKSPIINIINGVMLVLFGIYYALNQYMKYPKWTMIIIPIILIFINIILKKYLKERWFYEKINSNYYKLFYVNINSVCKWKLYFRK